jgi:branched-chain amino acid transport system permease protein
MQARAEAHDRASAPSQARTALARYAPLAVAFAVWLVLPAFIATEGTLNLFVLSAINLILAVGLSLLFGFAGQISLGQAAFYGLGAYLSSFLATRHGVPPAIGVVVAVVVPAALAYAIGRPVLRLRGYYLAMVTAGIGLIAHTVFVEWESVTGGYSGITNIPPLAIGALKAKGATTMYYVAGAFAFLILLIGTRIVGTAYGRAMRTMRESEAAARSSGIAVSHLKAEVFALSAAVSGLAGALYAHYTSFVSPESFTIDASVNLLLALVVGGVTSLWGAAIGAVLLTFMPEWFHQLQSAYGLVLGALVVVLLTLEPRGLVGVAARIRDRVHAARLKA